ncbi:hypothetical protein Cp1R7AA1_067 [Mesorhizobium phage Cp1R7A-A1]|nr:hypothetical protein Cp1R7AA1_067 [Mesorhizobium phage Cp1R7A-A1]
MLGFIIFLLLAVPLICVLIDRNLLFEGSSAQTLFNDWKASRQEYQKDVAKWGR